MKTKRELQAALDVSLGVLQLRDKLGDSFSEDGQKITAVAVVVLEWVLDKKTEGAKRFEDCLFWSIQAGEHIVRKMDAESN